MQVNSVHFCYEILGCFLYVRFVTGPAMTFMFFMKRDFLLILNCQAWQASFVCELECTRMHAHLHIQIARTPVCVLSHLHMKRNV